MMNGKWAYISWDGSKLLNKFYDTSGLIIFKETNAHGPLYEAMNTELQINKRDFDSFETDEHRHAEALLMVAYAVKATQQRNTIFNRSHLIEHILSGNILGPGITIENIVIDNKTQECAHPIKYDILATMKNNSWMSVGK